MYTDCHWHNPNLSERDSIIHNRKATTHGVPSYKDTLIWFGDEESLNANITKKLSNAKGYGGFGIDGNGGYETARAVTQQSEIDRIRNEMRHI